MPIGKQNRQQIKKLKRQYDFLPGISQVLRDAVINDYSEQELLRAVTKTKSFRNAYPGIFDRDGDLQPFLVGAARQGLSASTLATAVGNYNKLWFAYEQAASNYGGIAGKIGRDKVAQLIRSETSPEEFQTKLRAVQLATDNPGAIDIFNEQLKAAGLPPLKGKDVFKVFAGSADQKFYDAYESARIRQLGPGLDFSSKDAMGIAQALGNVDEQGNPTGPGDVSELLRQLTGTLSDIAPELQAAGYNNLSIAKYLANPDSDPAFAIRLQGIIAAKRGRGQYVAGQQVQRGPGGVRQGSGDKPLNYG
jgi:hypothetical protein